MRYIDIYAAHALCSTQINQHTAKAINYQLFGSCIWRRPAACAAELHPSLQVGPASPSLQAYCVEKLYLVDPEDPPVLLAVDPTLSQRLPVQVVVPVLDCDFEKPETNVLSKGVSLDLDSCCCPEAAWNFVIKLQNAGFNLVQINIGSGSLGKDAEFATQVELAVYLEKALRL